MLRLERSAELVHRWRRDSELEHQRTSGPHIFVCRSSFSLTPPPAHIRQRLGTYLISLCRLSPLSFLQLCSDEAGSVASLYLSGLAPLAAACLLFHAPRASCACVNSLSSRHGHSRNERSIDYPHLSKGKSTCRAKGFFRSHH